MCVYTSAVVLICELAQQLGDSLHRHPGRDQKGSHRVPGGRVELDWR